MTELRPTRHRLTLALVVAATAVVLGAQPALAATWGGEVRVTDTETFRPTLRRTGPASAILFWQHGQSLYAKRTSNGGQTWSAPTTVATSLAVSWSVAASGTSVDLVWVRHVPGQEAMRLFYRRSLDGGATWQPRKALTGATSRVADAAVARHANGQVSVVFTGYTTGRIYVRSSANGGTTFAAKRQLASTGNDEPGRTITYRSDPAIAIAGGITYVAYTSDHDTLSVRRSANRGRTWSPPTIITRSATQSELALAAAGNKAILGYTISAAGRIKAVFRRTVDGGGTWAARRSFAALGTGDFSMSPQFAYKGGVLGVVFKYGKPGASPVWYRESTDLGATWSARSRVSLDHGPITDVEPGGVAVLHGIRLAGYNQNRGEGADGIWVRRATP